MVIAQIKPNPYQLAKKDPHSVHLNVTSLMHYCEVHRETRDSEAHGGTIAYLYNMPDGYTVRIEGVRVDSMDAFVPSSWSITPPKFRLMAHLGGLFRRVRPSLGA